MATIVIKDLEINRELDKKALANLKGGYGDLGGYNWQSNWYAPMMSYNSYTSAYARNVGDYWGYQLAYAQSYGSSCYDFIGVIDNMMAFARG